jgi:hypothetical protein
LRQAKEFATARNIELLILIQPSVIDLTQNFVISYKDLEKYESYKPTNLSSSVEKICMQHSIHNINLFNPFLRNNPEDLFFRKNETHWNDRGQDLAARKTSSYIVNGILTQNRLSNRSSGRANARR